MSVRIDDDLRKATEQLVANGLRELPVVDVEDTVVGFIDEPAVARIYLKAEARAAGGDIRSVGLS